MTSPAVAVLLLGLVCSIFGTALDHADDHETTGRTSVLNTFIRDHDVIHEKHKLSMGNARTNINNYRYKDFNDSLEVLGKIDKANFVKEDISVRNKQMEDEIYTANVDLETNKLSKDSFKLATGSNVKVVNNMRQYNTHTKSNKRDKHSLERRRRFRRENIDADCEKFSYTGNQKDLWNPGKKNGLYASNVSCTTIINGGVGTVIHLSFVDVFHIEDHPDCAYDYLEIRDGKYGYSRLLSEPLCGSTFPSPIRSTGPNIWMKFHSDDTIEYEGFHIIINITSDASSRSVPDTCVQTLPEKRSGIISSADIPTECKVAPNAPQDYLWRIQTPAGTTIYLNFTTYALVIPNDCDNNVLQVFGDNLEYSASLANYCGSTANSVTTKKQGIPIDTRNIMHIRFFETLAANGSNFVARFVAVRTIDPSKKEECNKDNEFDCEDNTCIDVALKCDKVHADCRLKTDEDYLLCKGETESMISQPHILPILIIFSLILSGMSFIFLFKCFRKLYQDHKIIKEHIRQSCEDRLDTLTLSRMTLDAKKLQIDSEPRASLERENHTNEIMKRQRNYSQQKAASIDSDYIPETQLDLDDEAWRREVESVPVATEEVRVEKNGRSRRDTMKRELSLRRESLKEKQDVREKKENRDASVGAPDTKESGCQTRESLFQAGAPGSEGTGTESGSGSRAFSTFGYSGATIARPSPGPATNTAEITIEFLRTMPSRQESQTKKPQDRRPMSTETTRSAPDVIIVSKPIR